MSKWEKDINKAQIYSLFALQELHAELDREWLSSQFHCEQSHFIYN